MGASMAGAAAVYPLTWAGDAVAAWDFAENAARWADSDIANVAATPNWTVNRASSGYALNAAGVWVPFSSGEARRTSKGLLVEGARTNKCTNYNANPTDLTNVTKGGDAAATLSVVSDTTALTAAGLSGICTSGNVYCLNNSAGTTLATATFGGQSGNTNTHIGSAYIRGSGTGSVRIEQGTIADATLSSSYVRDVRTNAPDATTRALQIRALAGAIVYFILNQYEEASFISSPIAVAGASAARAGDEVMVTSVTGLAYPMTGLVHVCRAVDTAGSERWLHVDDGTANERFRLSTLSTDLFEGELVDGGVSQAAVSVAGAMAVGTVYKGAARFALNDVQSCRDGTLGTADTGATLPVSPNTIRFGAGISVTNATFGYVVRAAIYDYAMSNAQLQAATAA